MEHIVIDIPNAIKTIGKHRGSVFTFAGTGDIQIHLEVNKTNLIRVLKSYLHNLNMKDAEVMFSKMENGDLWFDGLK